MILFAVILMSNRMFAQAPEAFNYQAVVRNNGALIANSTITVEAKIRSGSAIGTYVYQETHSTTTDDYGMFNIEVGNGTATQGSLGNVDWGDGSYYLQIRANFGGNTQDFGATKLQSVPYALNAGNGSKWENTSLGIRYLNNVGIGNILPSAPLTIKGTVGLQDLGSSQAFGMKVNSDGDLGFYPNSITGQGSPLMLLDDNLRVGVGTSTPTERLHVVGGGIKVDETTSNPAPKTAYGNSLPIAYGYIDGGSVAQNFGIASMTKPSAGEYVITLNNNFSSFPVIIATSFNATPTNELITYDFSGSNVIRIHINKDSGPADSNFSFVVFGTPQ